MRKLLALILLLAGFSAAAQQGSLSQSVYKSRVNDTTSVSFTSALASATASGYGYMFYNNQATNPHYEVWIDGTMYHVFNFAGTGGGAAAGHSYTGNHTLALSDVSSSNQGQVLMKNTSAATVTLPTDASVDFPDWTTITIIQGLADSVTLVHPGVTVNKCSTCKDYTRGQFTIMHLQKTDVSNTWNSFGTADTGSGGGGGSGTVTEVSSANGNAMVATGTTTPVITIVSAPKWTTGRTIGITGDVLYTSPSLDGSGNVTAAGTLATVNSNVGSFGSATQSLSVTVNGKGLVTAMSAQTITPAVGSITGLGTGVASALAVNIGSSGAVVINTTFVDNETPSGTINGSNTAFTIANTPVTGSVHVYKNGLRQTLTTDYTISGTTITFVTAPSSGAVLKVDYRK